MRASVCSTTTETQAAKVPIPPTTGASGSERPRQGTFQVPPFQTVGENPMSVASGDFNGDGRLDLVTASSVSGGAIVLLGKNDGTFDMTQNGVNDGVTSVITADLNGDGKLDAAVTGVTSTVNVLLGRGDGTLQAAVPYHVGFSPRAVTLPSTGRRST